MLNEDLLNIFAQSFRYNWELPALQDYGSSSVLTYGDLARRIARTHIFFRLNGVKPGAKIAVMGKNSVSWIVSYMATVTYGAVVVPILHDFNPQDAQHIINHSDTSMLFVQDYIWEHFDPEQLPGVKVAMSLDTNEILMEKESEKGKAKKAMEKVVAEFNRKYPKGFNREDVAYMHFSPDTLAEINYTSGTTGFSKGVMLTLNNLCGNVVYGLNSGLHPADPKKLSLIFFRFVSLFFIKFPRLYGGSVTIKSIDSVSICCIATIQSWLYIVISAITNSPFRRNLFRGAFSTAYPCIQFGAFELP